MTPLSFPSSEAEVVDEFRFECQMTSKTRFDDPVPFILPDFYGVLPSTSSDTHVHQLDQYQVHVSSSSDWIPLPPAMDPYSNIRIFMLAIANGEFEYDDPTTIEIKFPEVVSVNRYRFVGDDIAPARWEKNRVSHAVFKGEYARDCLIVVRNIV